MPKYTFSGDHAALVLPVTPRIVLDKGIAVEITQADHEKLVKHKIIALMIEAGLIAVEGGKPPKPEETAEEKATKAAEKKLKGIRDALTKKGIEFTDDESMEQLEEKLKASA